LSDWDDMIDMGYGNSDGTLTDRFYDSCEDYEDTQNHKIEYEYIEVDLTPSEYLSSNEKYIRAKILNHKELVDWNDFELMHEKSNNYDSMAIQVFYNEIFIGYIKKNNSRFSSSEINTFCFEHNNLIELWINFVDDSFQIRRVLNETIKQKKEEAKELEYQRKVLEEKHKKNQETELNREKLKEMEIAKLKSLKDFLVNLDLQESFLVELAKPLNIQDSVIKIIEKDISSIEKQPFGSFDISEIKVNNKFLKDMYEDMYNNPYQYAEHTKPKPFWKLLYSTMFR
jgi:hypothetical protein